MSTRLNLDRLKTDDYFCYQIASRASGQTSGWCKIDIGALKIGPEARFRLAQASFDHEAAIAAAKRAASALPPPTAPTEPQINFTEVEVEQQRDIQSRADEAAARNRLNEYADAGLENSQHNFDAIAGWIRGNVKGYWSATGVNLAIQWLGPGKGGSNILHWKPKAAPATPPAAEPTEHLEPWQLRIDATEAEMKKADVKALKDLLARRRAATGQQYIGRGARINRLVSNF
jgi:hypothetical protein